VVSVGVSTSSELARFMICKFPEELLAISGSPDTIASAHVNPKPDGRPVVSIGDARNIRPASGIACDADQCFAQVISNIVDPLSEVSRRELGLVPFVAIQAAGFNSLKSPTQPLRFAGTSGLTPASSVDRRNTCVQSSCWSLKAQGPCGSLIQA
jgi:hypothetical protein